MRNNAKNILPTSSNILFIDRQIFFWLGRASQYPDGLLDPVSDFIGKNSVAGARPGSPEPALRLAKSAKSAKLITGANTLAMQKDS
jgi:hypothetical protein